MSDAWESGKPYEAFMGRWSSLVAEQFLRQFDYAPRQNWLDVGCGTGALSRQILAKCLAEHVWGIDPSEEFVEYARQAIDSDRATFLVGDGAALEMDSNVVDVCVSGFVLNFVADQGKALAEMMRVVRPGGRIGIFVWDYAEGMEMLRYFWDAAIELDEKALAHDEGRRFPICKKGALGALAKQVGLAEIGEFPVSVASKFDSFEDYWAPFLGRVGPAPAYVNSLDEQSRAALRDNLMARLPMADDGSITLMARAWAIAATV